MGWRFRKTLSVKPFRFTLSTRGLGVSSGVGIRGFRVGVSSSGDYYVSLGIPGTGLYWVKYFRRKGVPPAPE